MHTKFEVIGRFIIRRYTEWKNKQFTPVPVTLWILKQDELTDIIIINFTDVKWHYNFQP